MLTLRRLRWCRTMDRLTERQRSVSLATRGHTPGRYDRSIRLFARRDRPDTILGRMERENYSLPRLPIAAHLSPERGPDAAAPGQAPTRGSAGRNGDCPSQR